MKSGKISEIIPEKEETWRNNIFLTFDIDWAHDDVISKNIKIIEEANIKATWFITHETSILKRIRENDNFELGIHPNFNFLLNGDHRNGRNAREVVEKLMKIVPEAKSVRSHSMMTSNLLLDIFADFGLTHETNNFIPALSKINLKPWRFRNNLISVPYMWEDDIACNYMEQGQLFPSFKDIISLDELIVFDFHPIHIFLNTENLIRYEKTRPLHYRPKELIKHRFDGYGTRDRLIELLNYQR